MRHQRFPYSYLFFIIFAAWVYAPSQEPQPIVPSPPRTPVSTTATPSAPAPSGPHLDDSAPGRPTMMDASWLSKDQWNALPTCVSNAQAGYGSKNRCKVAINRNDPTIPTAFTVPKDTIVYVRLENTRPNENVAFTVSATKITPPDIAAGIAKSGIPSIQTAVFSNKLIPHAPPPPPGQAPALAGSVRNTRIDQFYDHVAKLQDALTDVLNDDIKWVVDANNVVSCLSVYQVVTPDLVAPKPIIDPKASLPDFVPHRCDQRAMLDRDKFFAAVPSVVAYANFAAFIALPSLDVADLDQVVKSFYLTCLAYVPDGLSQQDDIAICRQYGQRLATQESLIDLSLTDVQKSQDTISATVQSINYIVANPAPDNLTYSFIAKKHINTVVTITGVEVISKVNSAVAVVTINQTALAVVVSTGISFSNLTYNTFAATPIIVNGQPVLDPSGKVLTQVTESSQSPSVIVPLALVSYRINRLSRADWETKCPNGCSFLIGGGAGANLTTKSADFDVGPSFQIGGLLLTPTVHWGRDTRLTNGVAVGQQLGSSPPSTLPTKNSWVTKWGFAITYSIPLP